MGCSRICHIFLPSGGLSGALLAAAWASGPLLALFWAPGGQKKSGKWGAPAFATFFLPSGGAFGCPFGCRLCFVTIGAETRCHKWAAQQHAHLIEFCFFVVFSLDFFDIFLRLVLLTIGMRPKRLFGDFSAFSEFYTCS